MADTDTSTVDPNQLLAQLLSGLTTPQAPPAPPPVDYAATAPTSASSLFGESLAGGPPSAFPLSQAQREVEGNRDLLGFARGLMSGGPFARGGDVIAGGLQGAAGAQANAELAAAGQQQAAQEWQTTNQANRIEQLKAALPVLTLQYQQRQAEAARRLAGGDATTPGGPGSGTSLATVARDPKAGTAGQQANNPGNVMSTNAPGQSGVMNLSGGRTLAVFPDLTTGIAANAANLGSYATAHGISTVQDAVKRWVLGPNPDPKAPQPDLTSYIGDVSKALGVKPTDTIDLTDPAVQSKFIMAQQPHESGKLWLSQADVDQGVALAQQWRQGKGAPGTATAAAAPPAGPTAPPAAPAVAPGVTMAEPGVPAPPPPGPGAVGPVAGIGAALNPGAASTTLPVPPIPPSAIVTKGTPMPVAGKLLPPTPRKMSDADIVMQGMRLAQATPVQPGAPLAAGGNIGQPAPLAPAPNVWGAPAPPSAVLNYNGGATTVGPAVPAPQPGSKAPPPAPPALVTQPAGQPPTPAQQPYPDIKAGDVTVRHPGSFATFYAQEHVPPPTTEDFNPNLTPAQEAGFQLRRQQIATLPFVDQPKAYADLTTAIQDATQAKAQAAASATTKYEETQRGAIQTRYDAATKAYADAAQGQLTSQNKVKEINAQSDAQAAGKALEAINTSTAGAQEVINQSEIARQLSQAAGTPGFLAMWPKVADNLVRAGLLSQDEVQQLGAQRGLDAAINKLILGMKSQAGFSRFSNLDLTFLQNTAPSSFTPEQLRTPMLAFIQTSAQRQLQYGHLVNSLHSGGMPVWEAEQEADKQLGHVLQQPPTMDNVTDPNAKLAAQGQWVTQNVPVGSFYLKPNGQLAIRGAPQTQQSRQQGQ